jgi:hypothetical protein
MADRPMLFMLAHVFLPLGQEDIATIVCLGQTNSNELECWDSFFSEGGCMHHSDHDA